MNLSDLESIYNAVYDNSTDTLGYKYLTGSWKKSYSDIYNNQTYRDIYNNQTSDVSSDVSSGVSSGVLVNFTEKGLSEKVIELEEKLDKANERIDKLYTLLQSFIDKKLLENEVDDDLVFLEFFGKLEDTL